MRGRPAVRRAHATAPTVGVARDPDDAVGDVPGIDNAFFTDLAHQAKDCTISRALTGTEITLEASLAGA